MRGLAKVEIGLVGRSHEDSERSRELEVGLVRLVMGQVRLVGGLAKMERGLGEIYI